MTKSPNRKVVIKKKTQTASRKVRHRVAAERASTSSRVKATSVDEKVRVKKRFSKRIRELGKFP